MIPLSDIERAAVALNTVPQQVQFELDRFNESTAGSVVRAVFSARIQHLIECHQGLFRSCDSASLPRIQGGIAALEAAIAVINQRNIISNQPEPNRTV